MRSDAAIATPIEKWLVRGRKIEMIQVEHTRKLATPALEIVFADVAQLRLFMHSETGCYAPYDDPFLRDIFGAGSGGVGGGARVTVAAHCGYSPLFIPQFWCLSVRSPMTWGNRVRSEFPWLGMSIVLARKIFVLYLRLYFFIAVFLLMGLCELFWARFFFFDLFLPDLGSLACEHGRRQHQIPRTEYCADIRMSFRVK